MLYVANNNGVLQYDGERWRKIHLNSKGFIRSLEVDSTIYVGATGNLGYLTPDSTGTLQFQSLLDHLPERERSFEDIWNTHRVEQGIYFQAQKWLFRWDGEEMTSWTSEEGFHTSFSVRGRFFVRDFNRGLLEIRGDSLHRVPKGKTFQDTPIYGMMPYRGDRILIATQNRGVLLYDGETLESFAEDIHPYLDRHNLYHATVLPDGRYAFATLGGGVAIVDGQGEVDRILDSTELPDGVVNHLYAGKHGTLWMALNNSGVFRANVGNAVSLYDERNGLGGLITDINRVNGKLRVVTGSGLYRLNAEGREGIPGLNWKFQKDSGISLGRRIIETEMGILFATQEGIYFGGRGQWSSTFGNNTYDLHSREGSSEIYAGWRNGLLKHSGSDLQQDWTPIKGFEGEAWFVQSVSSQTLWVGNWKKGELLRLSLNQVQDSVKRVVRYGREEGLPEGQNFVLRVDGRTLVVTKEGVFQVREREGKEAPTLTYLEDFLPGPEGTESALRTLQEGPSGRLWLVRENRVYKGTPRGESYAWEEIEELHFPKPEIVRLHVEENGVVWLGSGKQLFRYDTGASTVPSSVDTTFQALVREVAVVEGEQVLYGGAPRSASAGPLTIPYQQNDLQIQVAAPHYSTSGDQHYQFRLDGAEGDWSGWSETPQVTYTNLWEGTYTFQVRARTETGVVSDPAQLTIRIQPPWYRTGWAYAVYVGLLAVVGLVGRRYYRLRRASQRAQERAEELRQERVVNERLKEANEQLREANRLKEEFLANISHELRTPLTNILGFADVLRDNASAEQQAHLEVVEENSRRLLDTLEALLDLATLRSGEAEPDMEPVEVRKQVHTTVREIRSQAEEKGLEVRTDIPSRPLYAQLDERYFRQVLRNLLENAVKFTPEGHIAVSAEQVNGVVAVTVADTGIGIDEDFRPDLFEDFKQESRGMSRTFEGSGLGLAISQRLVQLMDGEIEVESTKGEGSAFTVRVPQAGHRSAAQSGEAEAAASSNT